MSLNVEYGDHAGIKQSIASKLTSYYGEDTTPRKEKSTLSYAEAKATGNVEAMIGCKLRDLRKKGKSSDIEATKALMQLPIYEIQRQYKASMKHRDELAKKLEDTLNKKREEFYKEFIKIGGMSDIRAKGYAEEALDEWMVKDPDYQELSKEFTLSRIQFNSTRIAKENWIEDHQDIIEAEKQKNARDELYKADKDFLEELGIKQPNSKLSDKTYKSDKSYQSDDELRTQAILEAE